MSAKAWFLHLGVAGRSERPSETPEPRPGEGAEPGQVQSIRWGWSAPEVQLFYFRVDRDMSELLFSFNTFTVIVVFLQMHAPECRVGGARGGVQQESISPEQSHHQRTGEWTLRDVTIIIHLRNGCCLGSVLWFIFSFQLLLDCSELESRLTETLTLVNTDDYGKDELGTQSLLTKHKVQHSLWEVCH